MYSLNMAQLIGNLTKDPEVKQSKSGKLVATISLATNREWTDKNTGERKKETDYHNIVLWGRLAEIAGQYLHKGDKAYISGRLQTRTWETNGNKNYRTEIVADQLIMLGSKQKDTQQEYSSSLPVSVEDLPF
jgi:single-strand DNA-binding protein